MEEGIRLADSVDPKEVRDALLNADTVNHPLLGPSGWGGKEIYGTDNWLMTPFYIGEINAEGRVAVVDIISMTDWWDKWGDLAIDYFEREGLMR